MSLSFDQILKIIDGGGTLALSVIVWLSIARIDRRIDAMHGQVVDLLSDALGMPRPERYHGRGKPPPTAPAAPAVSPAGSPAGSSEGGPPPRGATFHRGQTQ